MVWMKARCACFCGFVQSVVLGLFGLQVFKILFVDGMALDDASSPDYAKVEDFVENWMQSE